MTNSLEESNEGSTHRVCAGQHAGADTHVTVRIEGETQPPSSQTPEFVTDDPAFGIWRDRQDMVDVQAYVRKLRAPRYRLDGSSKDS